MLLLKRDNLTLVKQFVFGRRFLEYKKIHKS